MKYLKFFENFEATKEEEALKEIEKLGEIIQHGDRRSVLINNVKIRIYAEKGHLLLASIISLNKEKGNSRLVMSKITEILDNYQVKMELVPASMSNDGLNDIDLIKWYKRLGFIEELENVMVRYPKKISI